jgi:hypothetical protein
MKPIGWIVTGFVAGIAVSSLAVAALPRFGDTLSASAPATQAPEASVQTDPVVFTTDERTVPEALTGDPLGELDVVARIAIMRWMAANPTYEFITRDYCGCHDIAVTNCPEYDARRERELKDYPYSEVSDYNGDKRKDFAVMLGEKDKEGPQILLIFNAPFTDAIPVPAFSSTGWARNDRIWGGYAGTPESDNGYSIAPKGKTYELVYMGNPH